MKSKRTEDKVRENGNIREETCSVLTTRRVQIAVNLL
jgi:hypothetical protein